MTNRRQIKTDPIHNLGFSLDEVIIRAFDAVIIINADQQIIYFNQGAENTFGYTADEVLEQPLDMLLPDRFVELHRWHVKGFLASHDSARPMGEDIRAITGLHQDGTEFPAEATIVKIIAKETNQPYMGVIIRDITRQKQFEDELSRITGHLNAAQRQAQFGSWEWYPDSNNLWWSDGFYAMLGLSPGKTSFGLDTFLGMTHPDDIDNLFQTFRKASVDPEKYIEHPELFSHEFRIILPDGNVRWVYSKGDERAVDQKNKVFLRGFIQDITERKQSLLQLIESERRFRQLAENIQEVFWMYDPIHEKMTYISPAYEKVWGRSCESLYAAPRSFLEATHPDDRPSVFDMLERQMDGKRTEVEYRVIQPDGKIRWVWDRGFPIFDDTGRVIRVAGVAADITQRKDADAQIRYQANLVENVSDAIISTDNQFKVQSWNMAAEEIYGWQAEEILGKRLSEVIKTTYSNEQAEDVIKQFLDKGYWQGEVIQTRKDGSTINIMASISSLKDQTGNAFGSVGINRDITQQVRAEARYQVLFDEAPVMYVVTQAQEQIPIIVDCNQIFLSTLNYARSEVIGRALGDFYTPASRAALIEGYKQALQGNFSAAERQLVTRSGQVVDTLLRVKQEFNATGAVIGTRAMFVDITEGKQSEREREKLLNQIKAGREELRALSTRLVEIQENERRYLALELHDRVGQRLAALDLNLNLINGLLAQDPPAVDQIQTLIDTSLDLLAQTGERVRDVMADLRPPVLDDYGILAALDWYATKFMASTGTNVMVTGMEPDPRLDPPVELVLFRIAQEALTNVLKHAQAKNVTIHLDPEAEGRVRLVMADDGAGFILASQAGLPDQQSLGLVGMMERAKSVGAQCRIESNPGQGTRVIVEVSR